MLQPAHCVALTFQAKEVQSESGQPHVVLTGWALLMAQGLRLSGMGDLQDPKMGVSENSVPLNPMVNDHYPY